MIKVIPQPKTVFPKSGKVFPGEISGNDGFGAPEAFREYRARFGLAPGNTPVECRRDGALAPGAYTLDCSETITLRASDETGMHHALATLMQLSLTADGGGFDAVRIEDGSDYPYRGLMIDTARIFHPTENLLSYVDLCWLYKMSYFHIHFTDNESYTLPCDVFPELPTEGRHYTKDQIAVLCGYAKSRGVRIMPEIDVPGHCRSFSEAYPEIFTVGDAKHIIAFTPRVFDAFGKLFTELADTFPDSDRIHIGGDEADIGVWLRYDENLAYAAECGVPADGDERLSAERIYATFVRKLSDIVLSLDRTPVCWEGFCREVNYLVPRATEVFSWEMYYQLTADLIAGGYNIINGSWIPNYIVWPHHHRPVKELFDWTPRRYRAVHPGSPFLNETYEMPEYDRLMGGQLLSWGDHGAAAADPDLHLAGEFTAIAERLPATAEGSWNGEKRISFAEFEQARLALDAPAKSLYKAIRE